MSQSKRLVVICMGERERERDDDIVVVTTAMVKKRKEEKKNTAAANTHTTKRNWTTRQQEQHQQKHSICAWHCVVICVQIITPSSFARTIWFEIDRPVSCVKGNCGVNVYYCIGGQRRRIKLDGSIRLLICEPCVCAWHLIFDHVSLNCANLKSFAWHFLYGNSIQFNYYLRINLIFNMTCKTFRANG